MFPRSTLATAAAAFSYLVVVVGGNPCGWNFTINGESSAYAYSMLLQPDGSSFSATEGSCLCESSSSCDFDASPTTGSLLFSSIEQTGDVESGFLVYGTEVATTPGPRVFKVVDGGYFDITPMPGSTDVRLYAEPEDHAVCTKAECLFAHASLLVNGVGCVGMAGHVEVTVLNDELIPVGLAEYDFECAAGVLPTCQTKCAMTRSYEGITQIRTHPDTVTIWETEEGQICYDAEYENRDWYQDDVDFNVEGAFLFPWALDDDGYIYVEGGACSLRPDYRVSRILVSATAVRVQLACIVLILVLCGGYSCCFCRTGGTRGGGFLLIEWIVSVCDTVCEVSAIIAMMSSIQNCGTNDHCADSSTVAITCIAIGQAIPTQFQWGSS